MANHDPLALAQSTRSHHAAPPPLPARYQPWVDAHAGAARVHVVAHDWALAGSLRRPLAAAGHCLAAAGFVVEASVRRLDEAALAGCDVLVLASDAAPVADNRRLGGAEVHAVMRWVQGGGGLLLVPGGRPFDDGVTQLATRLGVSFGDPWWPGIERRRVTFAREGGQLGSHPTLLGVERLVGRAGVPLLAAPGSATLVHLGGRAGETDAHRRWLSAAGFAQAVALRAFAGRAAVLGSADLLAAPPAAADLPRAAADNLRFARNLVHWLAG